MYALRFTPRFDGDFFDEDPLEMLKTAPIKPTMIGINEVEMLVYGEQFSTYFRLSINGRLILIYSDEGLPRNCIPKCSCR